MKKSKKITPLLLTAALILSPIQTANPNAYAQNRNYKGEIQNTMEETVVNTYYKTIDTLKEVDSELEDANTSIEKIQNQDKLKQTLKEIQTTSQTISKEIANKANQQLKQAQDIYKKATTGNPAEKQMQTYLNQLKNQPQLPLKLQAEHLNYITIILQDITEKIANNEITQNYAAYLKNLAKPTEQNIKNLQTELTKNKSQDVKRQNQILALYTKTMTALDTIKDQPPTLKPVPTKSETPSLKPVPTIKDKPSLKPVPTTKDKPSLKPVPTKPSTVPKLKPVPVKILKPEEYFTHPLEDIIISIQNQNPDKEILGAKFQINSNIMETSSSKEKQIYEMEEKAIISQKRTMIPLRYAGTALGLDISWEPKTKTIIMKDKQNTIQIPTKEKIIKVNGKTHKTDVKPLIKKDRTYLSIANIAIAMGLDRKKDIIWNPNTKEIIIIRTIDK